MCFSSRLELGSRLQVAEDGNADEGREAAVVGYVFFSTNGVNVHISKIAVREDMRRCGIGSSLLRVSPNMYFV